MASKDIYKDQPETSLAMRHQEPTLGPVCTGVKDPVPTGYPKSSRLTPCARGSRGPCTRGVQRDFLDPLGTTLGPHKHEVTIEGYHEEFFARL